MRFKDLPPEVVAAIFSNLDPASLARCEAVCKDWRDIAAWDSVLRVVCIAQGYLDAQATIDDLRKPALSSPQGVTAQPEATPADNAHGQRYSHARLQGRPEEDFASYRTWLYSSARLKYAWPTREGPTGIAGSPDEPEPLSVQHALLKHLGRESKNVHRFKVDHVENVAFMTFHSSAELRVVCLSTGRELFGVDLGHAWAHIEAGHGWVVNNHNSYEFNVWRLQSLGSGADPQRGHLDLMRTIRCPSKTQALRLQFPHLATATRDGKVYVYDITTGQEVQHLDLQSPWPRSDLQILYIEFDDEFVFVLFDIDVLPRSRDNKGGWFQVYSRSDSQCLYSVQEADVTQEAFWYQCARDKPPVAHSVNTDWRVDHVWQWEPQLWQGHRAIPLGFGERARPEHGRDRWPPCGAVHFDERTGCLCLYAETRHMLVIPNYKSVFRSRGAVKPQPIGIAAMGRHVHEEDGIIDDLHTFAVGHSYAAFIMARRYLTIINLRELLDAHSPSSPAEPRPLRPPEATYGRPEGGFFSWTYGAPAERQVHNGLHFDNCTTIQIDATSLSLVGRTGSNFLGDSRNWSHVYMFNFAEWARMPPRPVGGSTTDNREALSGKLLDVTEGKLLDMRPYGAKLFFQHKWGDPGPYPEDEEDDDDDYDDDDYESVIDLTDEASPDAGWGHYFHASVSGSGHPHQGFDTGSDVAEGGAHVQDYWEQDFFYDGVIDLTDEDLSQHPAEDLHDEA